MNLDQYLSNKNANDLARDIGVPAVLISQWRNGIRPVPIERCVPIEKATAGQVTRKDLRPTDYFDIWPEIDDRKKLRRRDDIVRAATE